MNRLQSNTRDGVLVLKLVACLKMIESLAARAFYGKGNDAPFAQLPAAVAAA
jgi:hypothetical protein